ncbi:MAG TPA: DUF192 domain-containing protein [Aggregatilineales bacterium]|nr:DUF192 domain-containing protein [Aggregatilineales bacterium]
MSDFRVLKNADTGAVLLERAKWCHDFWCHLRGLMFRLDLPDNEGLLFVYERESRMDTSIHMLFCFFPIATIWLDSKGVVVDKVLAKPWRPAYAPRLPAQYFIEARPLLLDKVAVGDRLSWD